MGLQYAGFESAKRRLQKSFLSRQCHDKTARLLAPMHIQDLVEKVKMRGHILKVMTRTGTQQSSAYVAYKYSDRLAVSH